MGKEEVILWKNNDTCPNCGKMIKDVTEFRCCEFGCSYCSWKCAKEYVNKNYKEIDIETMSKRRHQKLEANPSEGILNIVSEINKRIDILAEKVGIDFNPLLPNIKEISIKEINLDLTLRTHLLEGNTQRIESVLREFLEQSTFLGGGDQLPESFFQDLLKKLSDEKLVDESLPLNPLVESRVGKSSAEGEGTPPDTDSKSGNSIIQEFLTAFNKPLGMLQKTLFQLNNPKLYSIEDIRDMVENFISNVECTIIKKWKARLI